MCTLFHLKIDTKIDQSPSIEITRYGIIAHDIVDLSRCIINGQYREVPLMGDNIVEIEINKHAMYYQPKSPYSNKYLLSQRKQDALRESKTLDSM